MSFDVLCYLEAVSVSKGTKVMFAECTACLQAVARLLNCL